MKLLTVYGSLIVLAFVNPIAPDNIVWHYYIFFCCSLAIFSVVTYFLFPKTKRCSLEEIAEVFDGPQATSVTIDLAWHYTKDVDKEEVVG